MWAPALESWDADGEFIPGADEEGGGRWQFTPPVPREGWEMEWNDVRFRAQCTPLRHLAFFPDLPPPWTWMRARRGASSPAPHLFGLIGLASRALSAPGAPLMHL